MDKDENMGQDDLDWERRVLCSDEACIGTIGPDGCCRECGKPYDGELPEVLRRSPADAENDDAQSPADGADADMQEEDLIEAVDETASVDDADDEWAATPIMQRRSLYRHHRSGRIVQRVRQALCGITVFRQPVPSYR